MLERPTNCYYWCFSTERWDWKRNENKLNKAYQSLLVRKSWTLSTIVFQSAFLLKFIEAKIKDQRRREEHSIKGLIKDKIDRLEVLQSEEIVTLLNLISNLHGELKNGKSNQNQSLPCVKCNNIHKPNGFSTDSKVNVITQSIMRPARILQCDCITM